MFFKNKKSNIRHYITDAAHILSVDIPKIVFSDILVDVNGMIQGVPLKYGNLLPKNINYLGGFYPDDGNIMYIARYYPDSENGKINFKKLSSAEIIYPVLHELRHAWQKKYHPSQFYSSENAVGFECINDPAEIDADAFAIAFILSEKTPFTIDDLPTSLQEIRLYNMLDNNQRLKKAKEISTRYNFGKIEKIELLQG